MVLLQVSVFSNCHNYFGPYLRRNPFITPD